MVSESTKSTDPITLLLVDDHPVVRTGYGRLLDAEADLRVVAEADSGEEGYRCYNEAHPDVVLLDLSMPGGGGLEALRRIIARDAEAKVLIFSMHESLHMVERAIDAGARGYLTKSSPAERLLEAVRRVAAGEIYLDAEALSHIVRKGQRSGSPIDQLSPREFQVFELAARGRTAVEIAEALTISRNTVGVHHANLMKKLALRNQAELVHLALRLGVIEP